MHFSGRWVSFEGWRWRGVWEGDRVGGVVAEHAFSGCVCGGEGGVGVGVGNSGGVVDVEVGLVAGMGCSDVGVEWEEGLLVGFSLGLLDVLATGGVAWGS